MQFAFSPFVESVEGALVIKLLQWAWRAIERLVRDVAGRKPASIAEPNAVARDVLDAWLDDDGMDATGL